MTKNNESADLKANVLRVLEEIKRRVETPDYDGAVEEWAESIDSMLDEMKCNDQFGTEGQNDPRGDFREGTVSIWDM
jgi:hypothetical protein